MLAKRIIPTILMRDGHLVKGEKFNTTRIVGNALQAARIHGRRSVDELMILDVKATEEGRDPNYQMIDQLTRELAIPVTVGGGVNRLEHIRELLNAGADKVCIGAAKQLIQPAAEAFGRQCITASLDFEESQQRHSIVFAATMLEVWGAGEILLQAKDRDGTMLGYNLNTIEAVCEAVSIPVIASGGCKGYEDMVDAIRAGADAVAAGALYQFSNCTPAGAAEYLDKQGLEVRYEVAR